MTHDTRSDASGDAARSKRSRRYGALGWLWEHSSCRPVRACRRCRRRGAQTVGVRRDPESGRAGYAGLQTCGMAWVCPVCNARIMAQRSLEIGAAVERWTADGGQVAFQTLTLRHTRAQSLGEVWDAIAAAWRSTTSGAPWRRIRERAGLAGYLRVVEVTVGAHGWHVHVHVLLFVAADTSQLMVQALHDSMVDRWNQAAIRLGMGAVNRSAQKIELLGGAAAALRAGEYVAKGTYVGAVDRAEAAWKIGQEVTNTQSKGQRTIYSTRSMWEVLEDARQGVCLDEWGGDPVAQWFLFERASYRRRMVCWSRGMRERVGLGVEATDEEIVETELGTDDDTVVRITEDGWATLVARRGLAAALSACEVSTASLCELLDAWGVEYWRRALD